MSRQVNNPTMWDKVRPVEWKTDQNIASYMRGIELWARQVYDNITGIKQQVYCQPRLIMKLIRFTFQTRQVVQHWLSVTVLIGAGFKIG